MQIQKSHSRPIHKSYNKSNSDSLPKQITHLFKPPKIPYKPSKPSKPASNNPIFKIFPIPHIQINHAILQIFQTNNNQ